MQKFESITQSQLRKASTSSYQLPAYHNTTHERREAGWIEIAQICHCWLQTNDQLRKNVKHSQMKVISNIIRPRFIYEKCSHLKTATHNDESTHYWKRAFTYETQARPAHQKKEKVNYDYPRRAKHARTSHSPGSRGMYSAPCLDQHEAIRWWFSGDKW